MRIPPFVRSSAFSVGLLLTAFPALAQVQPVPVLAPREVAQAYDVETGTVQDLVLPVAAGQPFQVHVSLGGATRTLVLRPHDLRSKSYQLLVDDGVQIRQVPTPASVTYQGTVAGSADSSVGVALINGQLRGVVQLDGETWGIQPVNLLFPAVDAASHLVYRHRDAVVPADATCGGAIEHVAPALVQGGPMAATVARKEAEIALDCDDLFYSRSVFGNNNIQQAEAAATNIINGVDAIYRRDVDVQFVITTIIVRTTAVYSGSISNRLPQFEARWNANHQTVPRDLAHLLSGQTGGTGVIGVAYLGVVCFKSQAYGASKVGFSNSLTAWVGLVAHESGHQFNAPHCSGSTCFIMCANFGGCGGNMTKFGTQSISRISSFAQSRSCLTTVSTNAPTLANVSPGTVSSFQPQGITLTGTDLDSVTSVQVGTATITSFSATPTTLNFSMPSPFEINTHSVTATNPVGTSNALSLAVAGNHPSVLVAPSVHFSTTTEDYVAHTDVNWLAIYFLSPSLGQSAIPGLVTFDIGAGFTAGPYQIAALAGSSTGEAILPITMPSGLPLGTFLYWQLVTYDPLNVTVPFETSNFRSVPVF